MMGCSTLAAKHYWLNTREGNIAVWRYADGKRVVLARSDEKVQRSLDVWHELALEISGTEIVGTVNDALRIKHRLERAVDGRIGFWTKRDSVTAFKDIRVKSAP